MSTDTASNKSTQPVIRVEIALNATSRDDLERQLSEIGSRICEGSFGGTDKTPSGGGYSFTTTGELP